MVANPAADEQNCLSQTGYDQLVFEKGGCVSQHVMPLSSVVFLAARCHRGHVTTILADSGNRTIVHECRAVAWCVVRFRVRASELATSAETRHANVCYGTDERHDKT